MDGLGRALGSPAGVTLGGRTYLCRPLTLARLGSCETYLLTRRTNPVRLVEEAAARRPGRADFAPLLEAAVAAVRQDRDWRVVPGDELHEWLGTEEGAAYTAWLCVRRCRLTRTPEAAAAHFRSCPGDLAEFLRVRDAASGVDLLGSLDWPPEPRHPRTGRTLSEIMGRPKYVPWRRVLHNMAQGQCLPAAWGRLTLYQYRVLCLQENDPALGGKASVDNATRKKLEKMTPAERLAFLTGQAEEATRGDARR